jgi:hypothetical protein
MRGTLGRVLLRVVGCPLIGAALAATWYATGEQEGIQRHLASIDTSEGQRGRRISSEKADEQIAEAQATIESLTLRMYLGYGAAAASLVVGVLLVALPSRGKRNAPAAEPPLPSPPAGSGPTSTTSG